MQKLADRQDGFSPVAILVVVLVVVVIGATGWVVYQHHKETNKPKANTSTSQTTTQQQSTTSTQPQPVAYLDIKEWGIKLPLSDAIKTAYYSVGKGSSYGPGELPSTMWLGLTSLSGPNCNPANNDSGQRGALGALLRVLPTDTNQSGQLLTKVYPNGATVNGWYYAYQSWATNNPCASSAVLQPIDAAFSTAATGIVSDTAN